MHWRVAMQIASIYGRPGLDYRIREMMITVGLNLFMRYLAQQGVKLVPVMGWGLSAIISGSSTWLLGRALVHYYEEGEAIMNQVADKAANQAFGKIKASISWKKTSKESSHEMEPNARIDRFAVEE